MDPMGMWAFGFETESIPKWMSVYKTNLYIWTMIGRPRMVMSYNMQKSQSSASATSKPTPIMNKQDSVEQHIQVFPQKRFYCYLLDLTPYFSKTKKENTNNINCYKLAKKHIALLLPSNPEKKKTLLLSIILDV